MTCRNLPGEWVGRRRRAWSSVVVVLFVSFFLSFSLSFVPRMHGHHVGVGVGAKMHEFFSSATEVRHGTSTSTPHRHFVPFHFISAIWVWIGWKWKVVYGASVAASERQQPANQRTQPTRSPAPVTRKAVLRSRPGACWV